jgi:hypothetical protein
MTEVGMGVLRWYDNEVWHRAYVRWYDHHYAGHRMRAAVWGRIADAICR